MHTQSSGRAPKTFRRDACDKCHQLKSRCERASGSAGCQRCARLGYQCVYSPALPLGRPQGSRTTKSNSAPQSQNQRTNQLGRIRTRNSAPEAVPAIGPTSESSTIDFWTGSSPMQDISTVAQQTGASIASGGNNTLVDGQVAPDSTHDDIHGLFLDPQIASEMPEVGTFGHPMLNVEWSAYLDLPALRNAALGFEETVSSHTENSTSENASPKGAEVDGWSFKNSVLLESDSCINRVLDLQMRLLELYRVLAMDSEESHPKETSSVSDGSKGLASDTGLSKAIEEIYAATHDFVEVTEDLSGLFQENERASTAGSGTSTHTSTTLRDDAPKPTRAKLPHTSTVLLLSSCYVRLVHIYELLVQALYKRCKHNARTLASAMTRTDLLNRIPTFRMTHSKLSLPPTASLGMHLVVINHMIKVLKDTMKSCASRNPHTTRRARTDSNDGQSLINDTNPSSILADLAMSEVSLREQNLREVFQMAKNCVGI